MTGALDGLLVVSLEQAVAAPYASSELAAAGARVIKIERAGGDFARAYDTAAKGESSYFTWLNQGKQSIALDIKAPDDLALLQRMIARADVYIQNLAPGAAERAGVGTRAMRAANPSLISCDISGYGIAPEVADKKAYDLLIQAESGLSAITGSPDEMGRIGVSICDIGAGMAAHSAILEALIGRGRTGTGCELNISLFDVAAHWMTVPILHSEYGDGPPQREGLRHPSIAPYGVYFTRDGAGTLLSIQNEREWQRLALDVLCAPDLGENPSFATNTARVKNRTALEARLNQHIGTMTAITFRERLGAASIAWGAVSEVSDVAQHPALTPRTIITSTGETLRVPARPTRQIDALSRAPRVDEHGAAIRREFSA